VQPRMESLTYDSINNQIIKTLEPPSRKYWALVGLLIIGVLIGAAAWVYQIAIGMGVAGVSHPVNWGVYLVNFVFWVGIAHSGTLISAFLFLMRASWRTSIARSAEAITVFALIVAGMYPLVHLGRVWIFYWLIPYPNQRQLWPNFQSPLMFDVVAINTYLIISVTFWFTGLIPDFAVVRDRARGVRRWIYGMLSLGWSGSHHQWRHYRNSYIFFAAMIAAVVVSVHSVVSWDFALSILPGWHATIFPPYFVSGAIHSGLALVLFFLVPTRRLINLKEIIRPGDFENVTKLMIVTGMILGYSYVTEIFAAWYSGNPLEWEIFRYRMFGPFAWVFYPMFVFNVIVPMLFFFKKFRTDERLIMICSFLIVAGMWLERYVIIISSLSHDFIPHAWGPYFPSLVEICITVGSFCLFSLCFVLFVRFIPPVSINEVKEHIPPPLRNSNHG